MLNPFLVQLISTSVWTQPNFVMNHHQPQPRKRVYFVAKSALRRMNIVVSTGAVLLCKGLINWRCIWVLSCYKVWFRNNALCVPIAEPGLATCFSLLLFPLMKLLLQWQSLGLPMPTRHDFFQLENVSSAAPVLPHGLQPAEGLWFHFSPVLSLA